MAKFPTQPGCSKCRYAKRGCRRCVENFVPASAVRAAKVAEKAVAPAAKPSLTSPLAERDPNVVEKRPRGRPPKSAQKPANGVTPKTPKTVQKTTEAKAALASPPSPSSASAMGLATAQKNASTHKRKPTASEPATATKRAAVDVGVRWADRLEAYDDEAKATAAAVTTTMNDTANARLGAAAMVPGLDDEITIAAMGGVGRYGDRSDEDLCDFPPELREALKKVSAGLVLGLHPVTLDRNAADDDDDDDDDEGVETGLTAEEERRRTQVAQLAAGTLNLANRLRTLQQGPALVH